MEQKELLDIITDGTQFDGAYNIRVNGKLLDRKTTDNIDIVAKSDKDGIDIIIKDNTKKQTLGIPVILTQGEITDKVYNDFYIGENCDVVIVAGCGIDNCSSCKSQHDGIHTFYVGKNSKVKYIETHYGHGEGSGQKVLNPETVVYLKENSELTMNSTQIEGVDDTDRVTRAYLEDGANLIINEKVMTNQNQQAKSTFYIELNGKNSSTKVSSRVVAKDNSFQNFVSDVKGNNKCFAHIECDAIIVGNARVNSTPAIVANNSDAALVHEATIGKIAGEQMLKLLTLGL
ncbi:MAG: SufD family Fe-S cluster assembly protein, partial [Clostridia bacterium]|nr:SufD family Fe-S cluster assembly protein [Clostridia bacterium]